MFVDGYELHWISLIFNSPLGSLCIVIRTLCGPTDLTELCGIASHGLSLRRFMYICLIYHLNALN